MAMIRIVYDNIVNGYFVDIKKNAQAVDQNMFDLVKDRKGEAFKYLDLDSVMEILQQYLNQGPVATKVAVLKWIHHLFKQAEKEVTRSKTKDQFFSTLSNSVFFFSSRYFRNGFQMTTHATSLHPVLLETLSNKSDEVVIQGLTVLAEIVTCTNKSKGLHQISARMDYNRVTLFKTVYISPTDANTSHAHYKKFLINLLKLFEDKKHLLEDRGAFIIRYYLNSIRLKTKQLF